MNAAQRNALQPRPCLCEVIVDRESVLQKTYDLEAPAGASAGSACWVATGGRLHRWRWSRHNWESDEQQHNPEIEADEIELVVPC